jgi:hypothetical protein
MKYNFNGRLVTSTVVAIIFTICQFPQSSFAQSAENNTATTRIALPQNALQTEPHPADGVDPALRDSIARAIDVQPPADRMSTRALPSTNPNGAPSSTAHQGNGKKKWIVIISAVAGVSAAVLLAGKKTSIDLSSN